MFRPSNAIEKYANGARKRLSHCTICGGTAKATATVMIVPKNGIKYTDTLKDRYVAFITNASVRDTFALLANVSVICCKRWGIETEYRVAKRVRPFTCSRNLSVRLVLFYFPMILYNLWKISCWMAGGSDGTGDVHMQLPITTDRMVDALYSVCM